MDDVALAADLVRAAGTLAARMLAEGLQTHYKTSRSDVVSAADHAAEELVVGRLAAERPDDGLVGEEGARSAGKEQHPDRTWFIDPVDGTYNFLSGLPYWCSAVGLSDADGPAAAAVYAPVLGERWQGGRDQPPTRNDLPLSALPEVSLAETSVATYLHPARMDDDSRQRPWVAVVRRAATVRVLGSASIDLAGVASGRIGLFLQSDLHDWDWVPGAALVLAAGGAAEVVEHAGHRWQIAGGTRAVAEARAAILAA